MNQEYELYGIYSNLNYLTSIYIISIFYITDNTYDVVLSLFINGNTKINERVKITISNTNIEYVYLYGSLPGNVIKVKLYIVGNLLNCEIDDNTFNFILPDKINYYLFYKLGKGIFNINAENNISNNQLTIKNINQKIKDNKISIKCENGFQNNSIKARFSLTNGFDIYLPYNCIDNNKITVNNVNNIYGKVQVSFNTLINLNSNVYTKKIKFINDIYTYSIKNKDDNYKLKGKGFNKDCMIYLFAKSGDKKYVYIIKNIEYISECEIKFKFNIKNTNFNTIPKFNILNQNIKHFNVYVIYKNIFSKYNKNVNIHILS